MIWKKFKSMTPEDKEEWVFKFANKERYLNFSGSLIYIVLLWMGIGLAMMTYYLVSHGLVTTTPISLDNCISLCTMFTIATIITWSADLVFKLFMYFYLLFSEKKWLKEHGYA